MLDLADLAELERALSATKAVPEDRPRRAVRDLFVTHWPPAGDAEAPDQVRGGAEPEAARCPYLAGAMPR